MTSTIAAKGTKRPIFPDKSTTFVPHKLDAVTSHLDVVKTHTGLFLNDAHDGGPAVTGRVSMKRSNVEVLVLLVGILSCGTGYECSADPLQMKGMALGQTFERTKDIAGPFACAVIGPEQWMRCFSDERAIAAKRALLGTIGDEPADQWRFDFDQAEHLQEIEVELKAKTVQDAIPIYRRLKGTISAKFGEPLPSLPEKDAFMLTFWEVQDSKITLSWSAIPFHDGTRIKFELKGTRESRSRDAAAKRSKDC